jgi:hypothetical protein
MRVQNRLELMLGLVFCCARAQFGGKEGGVNGLDEAESAEDRKWRKKCERVASAGGCDGCRVEPDECRLLPWIMEHCTVSGL